MAQKDVQSHHEVWHDFFQRQMLSATQQQQFLDYYQLLSAANDIHNLTAIRQVDKIITDHFEDSLALRLFYECSSVSMLADIGTGAGFPAIPLKIVFPHLALVAIEVNHKKREFLADVVRKLALSDVIISELDWRTFLRKTTYPIDLFCARASLQPEELVRVFKPSSLYKNAHLVYWASAHWKAEPRIMPFVERQEHYVVGNKKRVLVFFASQETRKQE